jgi:hypothetical protein
MSISTSTGKCGRDAGTTASDHTRITRSDFLADCDRLKPVPGSDMRGRRVVELDAKRYAKDAFDKWSAQVAKRIGVLRDIDAPPQ